MEMSPLCKEFQRYSNNVALPTSALFVTGSDWFYQNQSEALGGLGVCMNITSSVWILAGGQGANKGKKGGIDDIFSPPLRRALAGLRLANARMEPKC